MYLPNFIVAYSKAILSAPWRFTLVYLSIFAGCSHDFLTRGLKEKYHFKNLLKILCNGKVLSEGYIVLDETDIDKTFADKIPLLSWIFSNRKGKYIFGLHLVTIVWTNGKITIPLSWKIYDKRNGKTKIDLALELIRYCLFALNIRPKAFLFDSFYASEKILKYLGNHKQLFFSQLPKNRNLDNVSLNKINKGRPYWLTTGFIKGKIYVQVVRNRRKYYCTNAIGVSRKEQLGTYKMRWSIEKVFRFVKKELGFEKCQSSSLRGQNNHFGTCFLLYGILQDMAARMQMTDYQIKLKATQDGDFVKNIDLSSYFAYA